MVSQTVTVINPSGLHLRPAGNLCKEAIKYKCKVELLAGNTEANAKSVLSVLGACVKFGDEITYRCTGEDEEAALKAVVSLTEAGFGEEE
jgi:phosphocarrier protein